jgi:hypothetical protein
MENTIATPKLRLLITTYEFYNNFWHQTVTHAFYSDTEQDLYRIRDAHRKTDAFFDASFTGKFDGIILMNGKEIISAVK